MSSYMNVIAITIILINAKCLRTSYALLLSPENRLPTRNITCQHGLMYSTSLAFNCEACLVTSRNYPINSTLSLTGSGPTGLTFACLRVDDVEAYHENLIRECRYFPRETLNGHDDFCVASPFNQARGSYRACLCITNNCNINYTQCIQFNHPYRDRPVPAFQNTVASLTNRVRCYQSDEDDRPPIYSSLTPLCTTSDDYAGICKNYLLDQSVLCAINVDQDNRVTRQSLPPSIYSAYILKFKTQTCNAFTTRSRSIVFSDCQQRNIVCVCAQDQCDRDLETCRTSQAVDQLSSLYLASLLFTFHLCLHF